MYTNGKINQSSMFDLGGAEVKALNTIRRAQVSRLVRSFMHSCVVSHHPRERSKSLIRRTVHSFLCGVSGLLSSMVNWMTSCMCTVARKDKCPRT